MSRQHIALTAAVSSALLVVAALAGVLSFILVLQLANSAERWAETEPEKGRDTSVYAHYLELRLANAAWVFIVSAFDVAIVVGTLQVQRDLRVLLSCVALGVTVYLGELIVLIFDQVVSDAFAKLTYAHTRGPKI